MSSESLGQALKEVRKMRALSIRTAAGEADISPAYLQKLESDQVQNPSPNVLYALAKNLDIPYSKLMKAAGYVVPAGSADRNIPSGNLVAHALSSEDLTDEEAHELGKYLAWFRSNKESSGKA